MMIAIIRHAAGSLHAYLEVSQQWWYSENVSCAVSLYGVEKLSLSFSSGRLQMILLMNN